MNFLRFFILIILVALVSCGQKSNVDSMAEPVKLKEVYYIKMPLSESSLEPVETPLPKSILGIPYIDDVMRVITRFAYNTAARLGMGKQKIVVKQPIPDIRSPYLKSLSVKRVFFHIDNKAGVKPERRSWLERGLRAISFGRWFDEKGVSFDFIRELKVRLKMQNEDGFVPDTFIPEVEHEDTVADREFNDSDARALTAFDLISYKRKTRSQVLLNSKRGAMIMIYSEDAPATRKFLNKTPGMSDIMREMVQINKTFMIELKGKELDVDKFYAIMEKYEDEANSSGIARSPDLCTDMTCMDIKVRDDNVIPLLTSGNKLHIETIIDASKVPPDSFQLKGFIEFEVRINPPF